MGKGGCFRKSSTLSHNAVSLREESTGKLQSKSSVNVKSMLKLEHLQNLAIWANKELSAPSLGVFFGHQLASTGESLGVAPDSSLFPCQRCETILQPGFHCTVRIEKSRAKAGRRRGKITGISQNNVVYKCHFCSHSNLLKGTPKGHMKEICPSNRKLPSEVNLEPAIALKPCRLDKGIKDKNEVDEAGSSMSLVSAVKVFNTDGLRTPPAKRVTLLEGSRRKRNSLAKKAAEPIPAASDVEKAAGSSKRRRCWTSLKEIAQSSEHDNRRNITNLTIPFVL